MYKIILEKKVQKFLEKHKWQTIIHDFTQSLMILTLHPYKNNLDIKKIINLPDTYRLRLWKYRFLYEILNKEIIITFFDAWSRWDVYKQ
jgi:mRNA interferase RelE/StbE